MVRKYVVNQLKTCWIKQLAMQKKRSGYLTANATRLKQAIRIFRENKRENVPWPTKGEKPA